MSKRPTTHDNVYEPMAGETISQTGQAMCRLAQSKGVAISATFNDIPLMAKPGDDTGDIERAFWAESKRRRDEYDKSPEGIADAKRQAEAQRIADESAAEGIKPFDCIDRALWDSWVKVNADGGYGECIIRYAARWANLMDTAIAGGGKVESIADQLSSSADTEGITGFMYGCAVSILAKCWKHGEALRVWHNLKTQIRNEGEKANKDGGVLNPAMLNIG